MFTTVLDELSGSWQAPAAVIRARGPEGPEGEDHCPEGPKGPRVGQKCEPEGPQGPKGECEGSELASVYYMFLWIQPKITVFKMANFR